MKLQPGTKVLVEAVVTSCGNTICGICLHGYENSKRLVEVIKEHVHPFPGVQEWRLPESIEDTVQFKAAIRGHESWVDADGFPIAKCISKGIAELFAAFLNSIIPPPSSAEQGEGGGR